MDSDTLADILKRNINLEHEAILLYLLVAWTSGDEEVEAVLEEIAREEMYHLRWLGHVAVALGIPVTLGPVSVPDLSGRSPLEALREDMAHEAVVIEEYERQLEQVDDPRRLARVLRRLIADSRGHQRRLARLVARWEERLARGEAAAEGKELLNPVQVANLQKAFREEYTAILQYLSHSFAAAHSEASVFLEDAAIQEMKHMKELGETLAGHGVLPHVATGPIYYGRALVDRLAVDMRDEQLAHAQYSHWAEEETDTDLKETWETLAYQEADHAAMFNLLLRGEEQVRTPEDGQQLQLKETPGPKRLTVGNLFRQRS